MQDIMSVYLQMQEEAKPRILKNAVLDFKSIKELSYP
jgi:hypothetical protein